MPELQSKPETALAPAPVAAEVPSNDAVAKKASETGESKATVVASESEFFFAFHVFMFMLSYSDDRFQGRKFVGFHQNLVLLSCGVSLCNQC